MSVVIIGGNECMVCQYEKICKQHAVKPRYLLRRRVALARRLATLTYDTFY